MKGRGKEGEREGGGEEGEREGGRGREVPSLDHTNYGLVFNKKSFLNACTTCYLHVGCRSVLNTLKSWWLIVRDLLQNWSKSLSKLQR
jgi:hypothetical protein